MTLKPKDNDIMAQQIKDAGEIVISKKTVLEILHQKLRDVDAKNEYIVDRIDGIAVKELIHSINQLK